ncbi:hypothetical protein ZTR_09808 [Talaromyces verruculosus]|nr:hypothetical protein ZTR_09808 [Talaromyces verruculosus]
MFPANPFTDIENIHVRPNGDLLLNPITSAATYILDPKQNNPDPHLLHAYPEANSTIGIVETTPDVFAVAVGNYSTETLMGVKGSFAIWKIDLSSGVPSEELLPTSTFPLGVNGIHTHGSTLFFTNSAQRTYGSIQITAHGRIAGPVRIINSSADIYDDFALDTHGNAYVATDPNMVSKITPFGHKSLFAGNDCVIVTPTSGAFGRGSPSQECILYFVTGGDSSAGESGQVIAIDTC